VTSLNAPVLIKMPDLLGLAVKSNDCGSIEVNGAEPIAVRQRHILDETADDAATASDAGQGVADVILRVTKNTGSFIVTTPRVELPPFDTKCRE
jgi:hypothetical protein